MLLEFPSKAYIPERQHHMYMKKGIFSLKSCNKQSAQGTLKSQVFTKKLDLIGHPG